MSRSLVLAFALVAAGCGSGEDEQRAPPLAPGEQAPEGQRPPVDLTDVAAGPCTEGESRACKVDLGSQGGVANCFEGMQSCILGAWGPCSEPKDAG